MVADISVGSSQCPTAWLGGAEFAIEVEMVGFGRLGEDNVVVVDADRDIGNGVNDGRERESKVGSVCGSGDESEDEC